MTTKLIYLFLVYYLSFKECLGKAILPDDKVLTSNNIIFIDRTKDEITHLSPLIYIDLSPLGTTRSTQKAEDKYIISSNVIHIDLEPRVSTKKALTHENAKTSSLDNIFTQEPNVTEVSLNDYTMKYHDLKGDISTKIHPKTTSISSTEFFETEEQLSTTTATIFSSVETKLETTIATTSTQLSLEMIEFLSTSTMVYLDTSVPKIKKSTRRIQSRPTKKASLRTITTSKISIDTASFVTQNEIKENTLNQTASTQSIKNDKDFIQTSTGALISSKRMEKSLINTLKDSKTTSKLSTELLDDASPHSITTLADLNSTSIVAQEERLTTQTKKSQNSETKDSSSSTFFISQNELSTSDSDENEIKTTIISSIKNSSPTISSTSVQSNINDIIQTPGTTNLNPISESLEKSSTSTLKLETVDGISTTIIYLDHSYVTIEPSTKVTTQMIQSSTYEAPDSAGAIIETTRVLGSSFNNPLAQNLIQSNHIPKTSQILNNTDHSETSTIDSNDEKMIDTYAQDKNTIRNVEDTAKSELLSVSEPNMDSSKIANSGLSTSRIEKSDDKTKLETTYGFSTTLKITTHATPEIIESYASSTLISLASSTASSDVEYELTTQNPTQKFKEDVKESSVESTLILTSVSIPSSQSLKASSSYDKSEVSLSTKNAADSGLDEVASADVSTLKQYDTSSISNKIDYSTTQTAQEKDTSFDANDRKTSTFTPIIEGTSGVNSIQNKDNESDFILNGNESTPVLSESPQLINESTKVPEFNEESFTTLIRKEVNPTSTNFNEKTMSNINSQNGIESESAESMTLASTEILTTSQAAKTEQNIMTTEVQVETTAFKNDQIFTAIKQSKPDQSAKDTDDKEFDDSLTTPTVFSSDKTESFHESVTKYNTQSDASTLEEINSRILSESETKYDYLTSTSISIDNSEASSLRLTIPSSSDSSLVKETTKSVTQEDSSTKSITKESSSTPDVFVPLSKNSNENDSPPLNTGFEEITVGLTSETQTKLDEYITPLPTAATTQSSIVTYELYNETNPFVTYQTSQPQQQDTQTDSNDVASTSITPTFILLDLTTTKSQQVINLFQSEDTSQISDIFRETTKIIRSQSETESFDEYSTKQHVSSSLLLTSLQQESSSSLSTKETQPTSFSADSSTTNEHDRSTIDTSFTNFIAQTIAGTQNDEASSELLKETQSTSKQETLSSLNFFSTTLSTTPIYGETSTHLRTKSQTDESIQETSVKREIGSTKSHKDCNCTQTNDQNNNEGVQLRIKSKEIQDIMSGLLKKVKENINDDKTSYELVLKTKEN